MVESDLVEQALKLPNKTHLDSPVGDESKNKQVKIGGPQIINNTDALNHLEIA